MTWNTSWRQCWINMRLTRTKKTVSHLAEGKPPPPEPSPLAAQQGAHCSIRGSSFPSWWSRLVSEPPPMQLPLTKTLGTCTHNGSRGKICSYRAGGSSIQDSWVTIAVLVTLDLSDKNTKLVPSWRRSCEPGPPADVSHRCARPVRSLCSLCRSHWRHFWPFCRKDRCSWKISPHSSVSPFPGRSKTRAETSEISIAWEYTRTDQYKQSPAGNNQIFTWTYWTQAGLDRAVVEDVEFPILKAQTWDVLLFTGKHKQDTE